MAYVQSKFGQQFGTSPTVTLTSSVTVGNIIIGWVQWSGTTETFTALSDNLGNTYTRLQNPFRGSAYSSALFWATVTSGGSCTLTGTISGNVSWTIGVHEESGISTSSPVDQSSIVQSSLAGTGTDAVLSGSITTTVDGCRIFSFAEEDGNWGGTITAGTGYTQREAGVGGGSAYLCSEDKTQASAGSIQSTFTTTANSNIHVGILALKPAGGPAQTVTWVGYIG